VVGDIGEDIYFDWFKRTNGEGSYAFLRLILNNEQYLNGLRVTVRGTLAELVFPFLQNGSKIAVDGHLQTRDRETGKKVVEVTAEHIAFLENINWSTERPLKSHALNNLRLRCEMEYEVKVPKEIIGWLRIALAVIALIGLGVLGRSVSPLGEDGKPLFLTPRLAKITAYQRDARRWAENL